MTNFKLEHTVALDTNIFICALNKRDSRHEESLQMLEQIKEKGIKASISVLVLEEFFIRVYKQNQEQKITALLDFITIEGVVTILDVSQQLALQAASLRAKHPSLRTPDAIHLASAISAGANIFITVDKRIPRKIENLKVIVL